MLKRFISASVLVVLVGAASGANAYTSDKRTYFTFSQSVALPGVTLPAGTYMFRLADDTTTRKVIQVTNKAGTESFAMLHTIPVYRPDAPRDSEVRFMETASGAPIAVRAYWLGGERTGYGFIYSKSELDTLNRRIASEAAPASGIEDRGVAPAGEPVAEGPVSAPDVVDGAGVPPEEPEQQVAQLPPSEQRPVAQPASPAPAPAPEPRQDTTRRELPRTASPLALLLLGGLASTSFGLKLLRKS